MLGMVLKAPRTPLVAEACADPEPGPGEVRLRVLGWARGCTVQPLAGAATAWVLVARP